MMIIMQFFPEMKIFLFLFFFLFLTEKVSEKQTALKDKSDDTNKVAIVKTTLVRNFMSTTIFHKFWPIFCYCKPNSKVYKKT